MAQHVTTGDGGHLPQRDDLTRRKDGAAARGQAGKSLDDSVNNASIPRRYRVKHALWNLEAAQARARLLAADTLARDTWQHCMRCRCNGYRCIALRLARRPLLHGICTLPAARRPLHAVCCTVSARCLQRRIFCRMRDPRRLDRARSSCGGASRLRISRSTTSALAAMPFQARMQARKKAPTQPHTCWRTQARMHAGNNARAHKHALADTNAQTHTQTHTHTHTHTHTLTHTHTHTHTHP